MKLKTVKFFRASTHNLSIEKIADMLRYDVAFVDPEDPTIVAFPTFASKGGGLGGKVTEGRWRSYGIRLEALPGEETRTRQLAMQAEEAKWVTYRHPKRPNGQGTDYDSPIVTVTLAKFLDPARKDTYDL